MGLNKYGLRLIPVLLLIALALAALAWGAWSTAAPGRQTAQYPLYGHADDFSWIAGQLIMQTPSECLAQTCGCSILLYDKSGTIVQLDGPGWLAYEDTHLVTESASLVVIGHLASSNEPFYRCIAQPDAPGYIVDKVEEHPIR